VIRDRVLGGSLAALEAAVTRELGRRAQPVEVDAIKRQMADVDRKIANATDRLVSVDISLVATVEAKLLELQAQRKELAAQLKSKPSKPASDAKAIAAEVWRLDEILRTSSPGKVRHALSRIVKRITLDFEPGAKTGRGQTYVFTGGTMELSPKDYHQPRPRRW